MRRPYLQSHRARRSRAETKQISMSGSHTHKNTHATAKAKIGQLGRLQRGRCRRKQKTLKKRKEARRTSPAVREKERFPVTGLPQRHQPPEKHSLVLLLGTKWFPLVKHSFIIHSNPFFLQQKAFSSGFEDWCNLNVSEIQKADFFCFQLTEFFERTKKESYARDRALGGIIIFIVFLGCIFLSSDSNIWHLSAKLYQKRSFFIRSDCL